MLAWPKVITLSSNYCGTLKTKTVLLSKRLRGGLSELNFQKKSLCCLKEQ